MAEQLLNDLKLGIKAMRLNLSARCAEQLIEYIELLNHWNKAFNLTAIRQPKEMLTKHLLDSLAVLPFIGTGSVADIGSGAGLPGIPLALAKPEMRFVLIDSNGKKTRFMTQVKMVLQLDNVEIVHSRVEDYKPMANQAKITFDTVIARAYANIQTILTSTAHLHHHASRILIMQGKLEEQCDEPGYSIQKSHALDVYGLDAERHLIEIQRTH